jgi:hypothetical protein
VEEYSKNCKTNSSESLSCSIEPTHMSLIKSVLDHIEDLEQAFNFIFASDVNREVFFRAFWGIKTKKSKIKRWNLKENEKFQKIKCPYFLTKLRGNGKEKKYF